MPDELDPKEAADFLCQWSGDVIGRHALGDPTVTGADIYEAISVSWIKSQDTFEGVFSPHNHRVVSLFIDP